MPLTVPASAVAHLEGAFCQQDQAGNKVLDDILEAETDTEREAASNQCEIGKVEPGRRNAHQRRETKPDITDNSADGIAHTRIHRPRAMTLLSSQFWNQRVRT